MRSKLISLLAATGVVLTTSGCSYLFGPKADDPKPLQMQQDACIKTIPANIESWLADGHTDIGRSVDCAVGAIDQFSKHVAGQSKSVYTKGELAEFITEMLVSADSPDAGDTVVKTEEILRVKQILLGGANDIITKEELARLKSLLLRSRPLLVEITPSIPTLLFKPESVSVAQVTAARDSLKKILDLIANEFDAHDAGRPEAGFRDLLKSAHKLGLKNSAVQDWIPVAEALKVLILSGDPNQLRSHEWAPLLRTIAGGWGLALRAKYNLSGNPQLLQADFPVFESSIRELVEILGTAVAAHGGAIPSETFEKLIDTFQSKSLLPFGVSPDTAKNLLPTLFGKVLYGRSYPQWERHSLHFGTEQLARLRVITNDWISGQKIINDVMAGQSKLSIPKFGTALTTYKLDRKNFADTATYAVAQRAQQQLLLFMAKGRPPIHDDEGRLIVVTKKELPALKKSDLNKLNMIRVIVSSVLSGWAHDQSAADTIAGLLEPEVQEAYLDLREVGHDLNFIDIRSNQAGIRTFMENAIFMSSSDGNNRMGLQEAVEWLHFVSDSGVLADRMYHKMAETCAYPKKDVLGNPKLLPDCFRKEFLRTWASNMPNLPKLVSWAKADGSGERSRAMLTALENAARTRGASGALVDSSEFRTLVPIMHYLESIFARLDGDQNGVLDNDEIWKAFPLLAPFIKKMGNGQADSESMQKAILSYILTFGTVPRTDFVGKAKLAGWYLVHGLFNESADRIKILTVIGSFGQAAKMQRIDKISAFHDEVADNLRALIRTKEPSTVAKITDLFQCLPTAAPILARDMASNLDFIAPADGLNSEDYIAAMKTLIDNDSSLEPHCLPF